MAEKGSLRFRPNKAGESQLRAFFGQTGGLKEDFRFEPRTATKGIRICAELEKCLHVIGLPLPNDNELFDLQAELGKQTNIEPKRNAARAAM